MKLEVNGEDVTDAEEVAQHFNNYFIDAVDRLFNPLNFENSGNGSTVDEAREQSSNNNGIVPPDISFDLPVVTYEFVLNEINRIAVRKATGPDDVSVKLLKHACNAPNVIHSLTHKKLYLIHLWIKGIFLKNGRLLEYSLSIKLEVNLTLKIIDQSHYCLYEKAVNKDFQDYLIENRILTDKQFGFRPNHSCDTALLCMVYQWTQNVDQGYVNGCSIH